MDLERLYRQRWEILKPQRERCVCDSDGAYEQRCWGCGGCWHCVDRADEHHCIECCSDDFVSAKATWELRMRPSIESLLKLPNGHYGALVLACHQAEVAYKVIHLCIKDDDKVMRDAIKYVLINSGLLYDNEYAHDLSEKVRKILNMLKHDRRTGEKPIAGDKDDEVPETVRIARRGDFGFHNSIESGSIVDGERLPPTQRKSEVALFDIVCELCQGLETIYSKQPPVDCAGAI